MRFLAHTIKLLTLFSTSQDTTMPSHEVVYFDFSGRAEPIRILLYIAGVDFEDTRFKGADWPSIKPTTPLGQVPVVKIDGNQYCQSTALARYAAKLAGWYPSDPLDALKSDEVADSLNELMSKAPKSQDADELKKLRGEYQAGTMTQYANLIEKRIEENGGLYVAGKVPSYADLLLSLQVKVIESGFWDHIDPNFFKQFPGIMATVAAVDEHEKIKEYHAATQKD
jgi:glutathione S-transferase